MAGIKGNHTDWQMMFDVSKEQRELVKKWQEDHDKAKHIKPGEIHRYAGAIGGTYTWCFTPTSIGMATNVKCSCGEEIDITNYDEW